MEVCTDLRKLQWTLQLITFNDDYGRNQSLGTKSALGNKRQLTNQIAGKDAPPSFSFF